MKKNSRFRLTRQAPFPWSFYSSLPANYPPQLDRRPKQMGIKNEIPVNNGALVFGSNDGVYVLLEVDALRIEFVSES